jgi:hypothetical protein
MKKALLATAACAALGLAAVSQGAVTATITQMPGVPTDSFGTGPLVGYSAYMVSLTSDTGKITAVDFGDQSKGFFSALKGIHQDWVQNKGKVATTEQDVTPSANTSYDSFFLFPGDSGANVTVGSALTEDNDKTTSPFVGFNPGPTGSGDVYGGGTFLRGAWGIVGAAQTTTMNVAHLVLSDAFVAALGSAPIATPQVATENGTFLAPIVFVPEPMSAGLIGLGVAGMALRRRRA